MQAPSKKIFAMLAKKKLEMRAAQKKELQYRSMILLEALRKHE